VLAANLKGGRVLATSRTLTKEELEKGTERLYHYIACKQLKGLTITLTKEGQEYKKFYSVLGLSSKESIRTGLRAVDASPFKTIFVVEEKSGAVLFALSKNVEFVKTARKKDPPPPPPPPPPTSDCCQICYLRGGYACDDLGDGSCVCYGATRGGTAGSPDDELGTMAP
jgi:hypothetical protein